MATAKRTSARTHGDGSKGSARTERHLHSRPRVLAYAVGTALLPWTLITPAFADVAPTTLPTGGNVVAGSASISSSGSSMQITQGTNSAILNWQSFSIGSGASVNFSQPSSSAVALNRVLGNNPSEIFGRLTADGQVFLTNPNGVLFAKSASVDVGGLFATTLAIADRDFLAGRYNFVNNGGAGSVVNQGVITATNYAALAAPQVRNEGIIVAHAGTVALAAGDRVSLDMVGDGLIRVSVAEAALNASALNSGTLQADGGNVILTARSANALLDTIINNSGIIRANSLVARNGEIVLDGGSTGVVANSGTLEAVGADAGTTGGTVKVLGQYVGLFDGSKIDASGDAGGGTVLVGGSFHGAGPEQNASHTYVAGGASINADAIRTGNGGNVAVWSNDGTKFYGTTSARGGRDSGDGGFVEVSGQHSLVYAGRVDTRAPNGKAGMLLLDPDDATIDNTTDSNDTSAAGVFTSLDGNAFTVTWDTINTTLATTPTTIQTSTGSITVADSSLNSTAGELVGNGNLLHLDSATTININASIIANTTVSPLQFTAPGGINLGANLKSNGGNITFDNATLLTAGVTVDSGGGTILFSNTLDGTFSLGLTAGAGDISFVGAVGGGSPLGAVTINSAHDVTAAAFSGASLVQTTGSGATTLNGLVTANAAGGIDITNTAIAANGGISAPAAGASVNLHATASALSVGANSLAANTNVTLTADGGTGDISTAAGGTVTATSGAVQMTAGRSVTLNDVVTAGTTVGISFGQTTAGVFTANSTFSAGTSTTITGGANADTFNINTSITADLKGGAGSDVFALGGNTLSGTIDGEGNGGSITGITGGATLTAVGATAGFNGTTPLVTGNFSNITDLQGSGTLQGLDAVSSWSLAGTSGTYTSTNALNFSGFGTLQGGTQADTFTLTNNAAFTLRGGDALDVFALASHTLTGSIDGEAAGGSITGLVDASITVPGGTIGYNGTSAQVSANYSNITDLQGTGTLAGTNNTSSWSGLNATSGIYSDNGGANSTTFGGFANLQGGSAVDTFTLTNNAAFTLKGGDALDVFALASHTLTGSIDGEATGGSITGIGSATLTVQGGSTGFNGTSLNVSTGFSNITDLQGTGTLQGRDVPSTWSVNGSTYTDGTRTLTFGGFATLQGGSAVDTFNVNAAAAYNLNGGGGVDVFNLNATLTGSVDGGTAGATLQGTPVVNATLTGPGASAGYDGSTDAAALTGTFSNITTINANGGGTLTGTASPSGWSLNGTSGSYTDNGGTNSLSFTGLATLQGGAAIDTFTLAAASNFDLKGGGGVDVFALGGNTLTGTIDGEANGGSITGITGGTVLTALGATAGFDGTTPLVTGNFSNITDLQGSGTLQGLDAVSSWSLAGTSGTYTSTNALTFSGFGTLQGGTQVDTFTLTNNATFNLKGGDALDVFALASHTLTGSIDGEATGGRITGIGSATLTVEGATTGFNGTSANVSTGFSNITDLQGTGTLQGRDVPSTWSVNGGTYSDGTRTLTFGGFASLQSGTAGDTFDVTTASAFNLLGGTGNDVFNLNAALTGSISGGGGADTLQGTQVVNVTLASSDATGFSGTVPVTFSGIDVINGAGGGTLTGASIAATWTTSSANSGTYNTLTFSNFPNWVGGTNNDTFNLAHNVVSVSDTGGTNAFNVNASITSNLSGGGGADSFVFANGVVLTGTVSGGAGSDALNLSAYTTPTNVTLTASAANGFTGTAGAVSGGFNTIDVVTGGATGPNTLTGIAAAPATWVGTGLNSGTYSSAGNTLTFANFANLTASTAADTFTGINVAGNLSDPGGTATLNGSISTGGSQAYTGAVTLAGNTTTSGSSLAFGSTVDGAFSLTANSAGSTSFGGAIGSGAALASLATDAAGTTSLGGSATTTGGISLGDAVTAGALTLTGGAGAVSVGNTANNLSGVVNASGSSITLAAASLRPGIINAGSGTVMLTATGTLFGGGSITGSNPALSAGSTSGTIGLNPALAGKPVVLTGTASSWVFCDSVGGCASAMAAPQFQSSNPQGINILFNGVNIGASAITVANVVASTSATAAQIANQALQEAIDTDSVAKQIDYGFAGDVGTTPPMDHRIDETGISTPDCFEESREGTACK